MKDNGEADTYLQSSVEVLVTETGPSSVLNQYSTTELYYPKRLNP